MVHQNERVVHKVGKTHVRAGGEGISRIRYDDHVLLRFEDLDELRIEDLLVKRVDHVKLVFDQHFRDCGNVACVQFDLHVRETLVIERHNIGKRGGEQRIERADAHRAAELGVRRGERARPRDGTHHVARVGDKVLAVLCDGNGFADAVKELHAKLALKLLNLHRDGGLRVIQRFRCAGKALELGDF